MPIKYHNLNSFNALVGFFNLSFTCYLFLIFFSTIPLIAKTFTIMLDPAGDVKHTGREIDDCFERAITLQCAEKLKNLLHKSFPDIRIILTRHPGESLEPLQTANFANRMEVDFYFSIHCYQESDEKPQIFLYQCVYNPTTDFWDTTPKNLSFIPYHQAHQKHANVSKKFGTLMLKALQEKQFTSHFDVKGFFAIPFKPLIGIKSPALALEVSLKSKGDLNLFIEPVAQSIGMIIKEVQQ